jgi:hypothetical protein
VLTKHSNAAPIAGKIHSSLGGKKAYSRGRSGRLLDWLCDRAPWPRIISRLTKLSPDNAVWKKDLAWFDAQIEELGRSAGQTRASGRPKP